MFWNRPRLVSKKYKDAQSRRRRILLLSFGFVVVVLIGILLWLGYSKTFTIEKIEIKGITTIKEGELRSILDDILEDKLFFIFPRNNTALVPKKSLAENLKKTFTQIKDISVNIKDQHGIALTIKERKPIGVWCNGNAEETIETEKTTVKCFLLDDLGYVFSEAPLFSGNLFFKYFGGNLQRTAVSGVYLPKDIFSERIFFITSLKTLGLNPVAYTWGDDGDSILELSFPPVVCTEMMAWTSNSLTESASEPNCCASQSKSHRFPSVWVAILRGCSSRSAALVEKRLG